MMYHSVLRLYRPLSRTETIQNMPTSGQGSCKVLLRQCNVVKMFHANKMELKLNWVFQLRNTTFLASKSLAWTVCSLKKGKSKGRVEKTQFAVMGSGGQACKSLLTSHMQICVSDLVGGNLTVSLEVNHGAESRVTGSRWCQWPYKSVVSVRELCSDLAATMTITRRSGMFACGSFQCIIEPSVFISEGECLV